MIVYCTTNLINGKKYIGRDLNNNPKYLGSGKLFRAAVKKYGKENFEKEILCYAKSNKDLNELEKYYINYYNADKSDLFYNIALGGEGGVTCDQSNKKKVIYQYDLNGNFIKKWICAKDAAVFVNGSRSKIVSACTRLVSYKNFMWKREGDKRILVHVKRNDWCKKQVSLVNQSGDLVKKYESVTALCEDLKIDRFKVFKYFKNTNQKNTNYTYKI